MWGFKGWAGVGVFAQFRGKRAELTHALTGRVDHNLQHKRLSACYEALMNGSCRVQECNFRIKGQSHNAALWSASVNARVAISQKYYHEATISDDAHKQGPISNLARPDLYPLIAISRINRGTV